VCTIGPVLLGRCLYSSLARTGAHRAEYIYHRRRGLHSLTRIPGCWWISLATLNRCVRSATDAKSNHLQEMFRNLEV
jgi:hypothetical protein